MLAPLLAVRGPGRSREWAEARAEAFRLWALLDAIAGRFRGRATVYIVDPLSPQGLLRLLRHRIRRFPAFVIGGREVVTGWDLESIARRIEWWTGADGTGTDRSGEDRPGTQQPAGPEER